MNFEKKILSLRYSIKSQLIFQTLDFLVTHGEKDFQVAHGKKDFQVAHRKKDFQVAHGKKTFLDVIAKQVVDIRKIALHYHKTLT